MHGRTVRPGPSPGCWVLDCAPWTHAGLFYQQFSLDLSEGVLLLSRCIAGETEAQGKQCYSQKSPRLQNRLLPPSAPRASVHSQQDGPSVLERAQATDKSPRRPHGCEGSPSPCEQVGAGVEALSSFQAPCPPFPWSLPVPEIPSLSFQAPPPLNSLSL